MLQEIASPLSTAPNSTSFLNQQPQPRLSASVKGTTENTADHIGLSTNEITYRKIVRYSIFALLSALGLVVNFILFCVCLSLVIYRDATSYEWGSFIWVFYIFIASIPLASFMELLLFLYSVDKLLKLYVSHSTNNTNSVVSSLLHFLPYYYSFPVLTKRNFYLKIIVYLGSISCFVVSNLFVLTSIILWFSIPHSPIPQQWWFIILFVYSAAYSVLFIVGWIIYLISVAVQKWWVQRLQQGNSHHSHSPSTLSTSTLSTLPSVHENHRNDFIQPITSLHIQQHPYASSTRAILAIHDNSQEHMDDNNEEEHKKEKEPMVAAAPNSKDQ